MTVPDMAWRRARTVFHGFRLDDAGIEAEIRRLYEATGYLADPHTAIGIAAAAPCRLRRRSPRWRWRPRIRPSFPTRSSKRSAGGRRCRLVWRICTTGRSGSWSCRTNCAR